ncbi:MAG: hypothetical protein RL199_2249 [Pseudomonadota bacterium]|jgi:hypothetical protein
MATDWRDFSRSATAGLAPTYRRLKNGDLDDWLATVGLERRNLGIDVLGAVGYVAVGLGLGVVAGLLFAPRRGVELRQTVKERLAGKVPRTFESEPPPGYAS